MKKIFLLIRKNTHGDFNVLQLIYKNNHINSVIDFVSACNMPVVWELIRSYSYIDKNVKEVSNNSTIGILICKKENRFVIEYCSLDSIVIREYEFI